MRNLTFRDAIREALIEEMTRNAEILLIGEDLIPQGGSFGVYKDFATLFPGRIWQTPISEAAIGGLAVGAALAGTPVVAEIMFSDFMTCCMDEVVNQAAKLRYMSGGQATVPLVIRAPCGVGKGIAAQHSQSLEAWYVHIPGLNVVMPSTPADAKGLMKTALRKKDPTIFLEHKLLYTTKGDVHDGEIAIPFGKAQLCTRGNDVTLIATGLMVQRSLEAAERLEAAGIGVEVIDPRTLAPFDYTTVFESVDKTNRVLIVEEACRIGSVGSEIAATIGELRFNSLDGPVRRLSAPHTPKPFSRELEKLSIPSSLEIEQAVQSMMAH